MAKVAIIGCHVGGRWCPSAARFALRNVEARGFPGYLPLQKVLDDPAGLRSIWGGREGTPDVTAKGDEVSRLVEIECGHKLGFLGAEFGQPPMGGVAGVEQWDR